MNFSQSVRLVWPDPGSVRAGSLYRLTIPCYLPVPDRGRSAANGEIEIPLDPSVDLLISRPRSEHYLQFTTTFHQLADAGLCPHEPPHHRTIVLDRVCGELSGGTRLPGIVFDNGMGFPIISERVADMLQRSRLTGYLLVPVEVTENLSECFIAPRLFVLCFTGNKCERIRTVDGGVNSCNRCQSCPFVCPGCGHMFPICSTCGVPMVSIVANGIRGVPDLPITVEGISYAAQDVLDGTQYDGSDFVGGGFGDYFISRNALRWFVRNRIAPIRATPVLLADSRDPVGPRPSGEK